MCPVLYDKQEQRLRCYSSITYTLKYHKSNTIETNEQITNTTNIRNHPISKSSIPIINPTDINSSIADNMSTMANLSDSDEKNMLIICHNSLLPAAKRLASFRRAVGFIVSIAHDDNWTQEDILTTIKRSYEADNNLTYLLFLGDVNMVPSNQEYFKMLTLIPWENWTNDLTEYATDYNYACLDGEDDLYADFYYGRIPVSTLEDAYNVIDKIIAYEKGTDSSPTYYNNFLICSHLQNSGENNEEFGRTTRTAEEIYEYLTNSVSKNVTRLYIKDDETISKWNSTFYKPNSYISSSLLTANIWNTTPDKITSAINQGQSAVFYSGHGNVNQWAYFNYNTSEFSHLTNPAMVFYRSAPKKMSLALISKGTNNIHIEATGVPNPIINVYNEVTGETQVFTSRLINLRMEDPENYSVGITAEGYFPLVSFAGE